MRTTKSQICHSETPSHWSTNSGILKFDPKIEGLINSPTNPRSKEPFTPDVTLGMIGCRGSERGRTKTRGKPR